MTKDKDKKMVVPALRFPEFRDAEGWEDTTLGDIAEFYKGKGISKSDITINGHLPCIRYGELYTHYNEIINCIVSYTGSQSDNLVLSQINDVIIPSSGETKEDIATASCVMVDNVALGGDLNIIRSHINGIFLSYYLNNAKKYEISQLAQGYSVVHLYAEQLRKLHICTPKSKEQQKIADCLGSLDSLINTVADKIEVLKVYKKGLMQQLFPAEGKTTPAFRFPEFQNAGEWKQIKLGDVGDPLMCKRILKEQTTNEAVGNIPFYKIGTFGGNPDAYISKNILEDYKRKYSYPNKGDILISAAGTIGRLVVFDGKPAYFQDSNIVWIGNSETKILNAFLYCVYQTLKWQTSDGGIVSRLYNNDLKNMTIIFPENKIEQQKIADCLSSVDELISTEIAKLDLLKAHKKGLMQQLFPKL